MRSLVPFRVTGLTLTLHLQTAGVVSKVLVLERLLVHSRLHFMIFST